MKRIREAKYVRSPVIFAWDLATARPLTIADKCVGEWHTNSRSEVTPGIRVQCWAGLAEYWLPEVALSVTTRQSLAATRRHFSVVAMVLTIYKHNHEAAYRRRSHYQKLHKQLWVSYSVAYLPRVSTKSHKWKSQNMTYGIRNLEAETRSRQTADT